MFEDFENRMGFWKNLGSNFTIQYSGDAPSFMTDSEMWQSMDSGTTQTLAAWENGWVLTNNPDGTITANPKYTSGLPSETLTKVPIGFAPPTNTTPTDAGGGVVVAFNATEFDVPNTTENNNLSVLVKWVESTQTYHFKGMPMNYYQDTGTNKAGLVKNSTVGQYGGVKARLDAGQGLIFESLSPNDSPKAPDLTGESPTFDGGTPPNSNGDTNGDSNCDNHECPEGQNVMTSTNADGTVECSCFDGGKALRTVGYGLGALAFAGVATTGLVIYGIYRIVRG